ncbi:hypothetical protein Hanom_Chr08g00758081 [Helianthus anomalus]
MGTETQNNSVIYSLSVFSGKVNPSLYLYATSVICARLTIGASRSIGTSVGFRHPSFISFHEFSTISLTAWTATISDTLKVFIYASTLVAEGPLSRSNFIRSSSVIRICYTICYFVDMSKLCNWSYKITFLEKASISRVNLVPQHSRHHLESYQLTL